MPSEVLKNYRGKAIKVSENELILIEFLALCLGNLDLQQVHEATLILKLVDDDGKPYSPDTLNKVLKSLSRRGALEGYRQTYSCDYGVRQAIQKRGFPVDKFVRFFPVVNEFFPVFDSRGVINEEQRLAMYVDYLVTTENWGELGELFYDFNDKIGYVLRRMRDYGNGLKDIFSSPAYMHALMNSPLSCFQYLVSNEWEIVFSKLPKFKSDVMSTRTAQLAEGNKQNLRVSFISSMVCWLLFRGEIEQAEKITNKYGTHLAPVVEMVKLFEAGKLDRAKLKALWEKAYEVRTREVQEPRLAFYTTAWFFPLMFALFLFEKDDELPGNLAYGLLNVSDMAGPKTYWIGAFLRTFYVGIARKKGLEPGRVEELAGMSWTSEELAFNVFNLFTNGALVLQYPDNFELEDCDFVIEEAFKQLHRNGYSWLASQFGNLMRRVSPSVNLSNKKVLRDYKSMADLVKEAPPWELALKKFQRILPDREDIVENPEVTERLIWLFEVERDGSFELNAYLQKIAKRGGWTKGRRLKVEEVKEREVPLNSFERNVALKAIEEDKDSWGYRRGLKFSDCAAEFLVGHPLLFVEEKGKRLPIELSTREIQLTILDRKEQVKMSLSPFARREGYSVIKVGLGRYELVKAEHIHEELAKLIGADGLLIPKEKMDKFSPYLTRLKKDVKLHSDMEGVGVQMLEESVKPEPVIRMYPVGKVVRLEVVIDPVGDASRILQPGKGERQLFVETDAGTVKFERKLSAEKRAFERLMERCPSLDATKDRTFEWAFENLVDVLEVLSELDEVKDDYVIEWPEGQNIKFGGNLGFEAMKLKISSGQNWFELAGDVKISEDDSLTAQDFFVNSERVGRFIRLKDGRFVALQKKLEKRLQEVDGYIQKNKKGLRMHKAAVAGFDEFAKEAGIETAKAWKDQVKQLREVEKRKYPLPKALDAELRPYQLEGYEWLARLADWGFGACLADDMGLGKTVQALAVLIQRRKSGPALVVAPASVVENWQRETQKFAPSMNALIFGEGDREKMVKKAKAGDIIVCSFGLLPHESELLHSREWGTVVLDEAQMIKNHLAKRTKAAFGLKAGFRLATTGTPLENHLIELWSLFEFLNPGLLGNKNYFFEQFVKTIQSEEGHYQLASLKRLVQPFILRRRKNEVLEDLPPKTEITLHVEMGEKEKSFYEKLRQQSVEIIANADQGSQFEVLAQLTKLRRACCHPKLINEKSRLKSPKIEQLLALLDELRDNGHRALVFSQFVGFLSIVKEELDKAGLTYQYLDGSTPARKRQTLVDKFQNGEGDLFLISLKAGGTGLNLTAADYVIHLDPWWNPAVEDQASDRAHRIGQQRPVTVYRLVTQGTVEDKIIALHHKKRDLAEGILEGADKTAKLSMEDLLALLEL